MRKIQGWITNDDKPPAEIVAGAAISAVNSQLKTCAPSPSILSRRALLASLASAPALGPLAKTAEAQSAADLTAEQQARTALKAATGTKLVLLGVHGGPAPMRPGINGHMTSHLMVGNGAAYVLDCGLGVTNQYARTAVPFKALKSIFLTHHHPDHNVEYGPLLIIGWVQGMPLTVQVFGPPPLAQMTRDLLSAYKQTMAFWSEDLGREPLPPIPVQEISEAGPVMQDENVKVSAVTVQHPPVAPALAYRFDFNDRSIAFSGDTAPLDSVAKLAEGADILVHEAMYLPALEKYLRERIAKGAPTNFESFVAHMKADHSPVEDVGRIAQKAGVKTLVLSHLTPGIDGISDDLWRDGAAKHFTGKIIVGKDLMVL
jgi:ribonuclease BN (tRNA processing enzyme)